MLAVWLGNALFWAVVSWLMLQMGARVRPLPRRAEGEVPSVTVVITARDEAERIAESVRRWLDQQGVELDVVLVDDRSSDGTAESVAPDPRLKVVRIEELPEGWLGKNHACQRGAEQATGEWILFTDADAWAERELVADAIAAARERGVGHFSVVPALENRSLVGRVVALHFLTIGTTGAGLVNAGSKRAVCGAGAFNLIRRDAYRAFGGHESLRLEVLDDLGLAACARDARIGSWVADSAGRLEVDWAPGALGLFAALEKNAFAFLGYRWPLVALLWLFGLSVWLPPLVAPFVGGLAWLSTLAFATTIAAHLRVALRRDWAPWLAVIAPLASPMIWLAFLRSAWLTTRRGGVLWRDRLYPTAELRRARALRR